MTVLVREHRLSSAFKIVTLTRLFRDRGYLVKERLRWSSPGLPLSGKLLSLSLYTTFDVFVIGWDAAFVHTGTHFSGLIYTVTAQLWGVKNTRLRWISPHALTPQKSLDRFEGPLGRFQVLPGLCVIASLQSGIGIAEVEIHALLGCQNISAQIRSHGRLLLFHGRQAGFGRVRSCSEHDQHLARFAQ
jgi:hypothetical protein